MHQPPKLFSQQKYWASCFGQVSHHPMSRQEMDDLGWDSCDVILVTGDAYVDLPSFGMAVMARVLEHQGFRVGIISQPDWLNCKDFQQLGEPNLFFGVTSGNMDSMVNHYTSERRKRSDDAYTADAQSNRRPDRAVTVYAQRCREAYKGCNVVIGGIEASLRRLAHYDYWSDKVRRSALLDSKADILVYGNGERQILEIAHRLADGEAISSMQHIRGTAIVMKHMPLNWLEMDQTEVEEKHYYVHQEGGKVPSELKAAPRERRFIRAPSFEVVKDHKLSYAHASRLLHMETNPHNAYALVQAHAGRELWINPPAIPLTTKEIDAVFDLPYARLPHPCYGNARIPAYEMIRFSVNIMRGCFGGCTFCSITEHEGRLIQSRSEDSIVREVEAMRDKSVDFTGVVSDLGGPTANMYRLACKDKKVEAACRLPSCVYPTICPQLNTDHNPLVQLYRRIRAISGVKRVMIASGVRYDLAVKSPEYVEELAKHHVGGYLKIAPEHTENRVLDKMMKPSIGSYDQFSQMFEKFSKQAGKKQYLIPYFIAAHPGCTDDDMLNLARWLKRNRFKPNQVQTFLPSPMATASTMYHSGFNPLYPLHRKKEVVKSPKGKRQRELHKAFLRYHDHKNWPLLRQRLKEMGQGGLISQSENGLIPPEKNQVEKTSVAVKQRGGFKRKKRVQS
ncbi:MAG: YgiQ family radical SAM protein [Mariprofundaceae bacterium]|nr:YgiQ family radical SAM protein [Mariprofundaceae bacterium]